jgi:translation elongation factor EF-1beta
LTRMKVFPEEGTNLEALQAKIKAIEGNNTVKIEDYVFGAKIIIASFVCDDKSAVDFEERVRSVEGVSEVQVEEVGLIS